MLDVKQTLKDAEERMESAILYLDEELAHIRAGRANVAILDAVRVDSYGSKVPLNQVATVSTPDARTIAIRPWDRKAIRDIEKAIMDSDVGVTPENNGEVIRLNLPQPTGERRKELVKIAGKYAEQGKVAVRNVRRDALDGIKKLKKDNEISEDEEKRYENEIQKLTDETIKKMEEAFAVKEKDIMQV